MSQSSSVWTWTRCLISTSGLAREVGPRSRCRFFRSATLLLAGMATFDAAHVSGMAVDIE